MFCPKCGIQNPNDGKFCRGCGANLSNVLAVVDGSFDEPQEITAPDNSGDLKTTGVRNVILGMGFVAIGLFLFAMPGDTIFWLFAMLPGFFLFASGVSRIMKSDSIKANRIKIKKAAGKPQISETKANPELPPKSENYIKPLNSVYRTDNLIPPSVVEDTTRHLEIDSESQTMTLPEK